MNWYEKTTIKIWQLWRNFTKQKEKNGQKKYSIIQTRIWNMENWKLNPIEINFDDNFQRFEINHLIEINYIYDGINYIILYDKNAIFPPYDENIEFPKLRFYEKDFSDIEISLNLNEENNEETYFIENDSIDFNEIIFKLRGPGELFYNDLKNVASWNQIMRWIKRIFIYYHCKNMNVLENDIELEVIWSNGEKQLF
jgi:hypothetical protein